MVENKSEDYKIKFHPDKPIENLTHDKLGRSLYVEALTNAILYYDCPDCLVIGLIGPWGHGKTSIIQSAVACIDQKFPTKPLENNKNSLKLSWSERFSNRFKKIFEVFVKDGNLSEPVVSEPVVSEPVVLKPIVFQFNPWLFSNQNQLIQKFFDELSIKINDDKISSKFNEYVSKLIPPIISLAAIVDPNRTQAFLKGLELTKGKKSEEESLNDLKNEIDGLIRKLNRRIIIIIDDIDRLSPLEIRQIFQLVKLVGDFPNTVYLLCFDKNAVIKALEVDKGISGQEYIKKIVQIHFPVPEVNKSDIEDFLFKEVIEFVKEEYKRLSLFSLIEQPKKSVKIDWLYYYDTTLKFYFKNLRDVKLFINAFRFNYSIIESHVHPADFLAITAIQIFENPAYQNIRNNKELLTRTGDFETFDILSKEEFLNNILSDTSTDEIKNTIERFLKYMFPYFANENVPSENDINEWEADRRICSDKIFDIYFNLAIPQTAKTVTKIIDSFVDRNVLLGNSSNTLQNKYPRFLVEDY